MYAAQPISNQFEEFFLNYKNIFILSSNTKIFKTLIKNFLRSVYIS